MRFLFSIINYSTNIYKHVYLPYLPPHFLFFFKFVYFIDFIFILCIHYKSLVLRFILSTRVFRFFLSTTKSPSLFVPLDTIKVVFSKSQKKHLLSFVVAQTVKIENKRKLKEREKGRKMILE